MSDWPRRIDVRGDPDPELAEVIAHLEAGGLVAYPTETVYGIGGTMTETAVAALARLKSRETDKPFLVLVATAESVPDLDWTESARTLAEVFWPGPLTLVLADPTGIFPPGVRDERTGTVGIRMSPHPVVSKLLARLGGPLTSTSLNEPGGPPAVSGSEAVEVVRRLGGRDVLVLDAGTLPRSAPSTVVDCTVREPVVLREGAVPATRLRCAIPEIHGD